MRLKSLRCNARVFPAAVLAASLALTLFPLTAKADQWDKKTVLTINEEIQVRNRLLPPGTYVFKLMDSNADRHIVQIFNADQTHIIDTVLANPNYRLEPTGKSRFRFYETPSGHVKALRAWFYPGDNFGQEFPYPKHLAMLQVASLAPVAPSVAMERETQQEAFVPAPEPQVTQEPAPTQMAENAPPPSPMAQPEPAPAPQDTTPATLPKTSSPYPMVGLAGLLFVGAFFVARLKRLA